MQLYPHEGLTIPRVDEETWSKPYAVARCCLGSSFTGIFVDWL